MTIEEAKKALEKYNQPPSFYNGKNPSYPVPKLGESISEHVTLGPKEEVIPLGQEPKDMAFQDIIEAMKQTQDKQLWTADELDQLFKYNLAPAPEKDLATLQMEKMTNVLEGMADIMVRIETIVLALASQSVRVTTDDEMTFDDEFDDDLDDPDTFD